MSVTPLSAAAEKGTLTSFQSVETGTWKVKPGWPGQPMAIRPPVADFTRSVNWPRPPLPKSTRL